MGPASWHRAAADEKGWSRWLFGRLQCASPVEDPGCSDIGVDSERAAFSPSCDDPTSPVEYVAGQRGEIPSEGLSFAGLTALAR